MSWRKVLRSALLTLIFSCIASQTAIAAKQFAGATYYFDAQGHYNGIQIDFCNINGAFNEDIPGVPVGPYYRVDEVVCGFIPGGEFFQTGFDCAIGMGGWSCGPIGFYTAAAAATVENLPPGMSLEDSCRVAQCILGTSHEANYVKVPGGTGLHR